MEPKIKEVISKARELVKSAALCGTNLKGSTWELERALKDYDADLARRRFRREDEERALDVEPLTEEDIEALECQEEKHRTLEDMQGHGSFRSFGGGR